MFRKLNLRRLAIVSLSFTALSVGAAPAQAAEQPKFVKIAGSGLAGTWFRISAIASAILNEKVPGTTFSATLGGGLSNLKRIESEELEMGLSMTSALGFARYGTGPFKDKATSNVRSIGVLYQSPYHVVVRADSSIQSIADFKDKEIAVGKSNWSTELFSTILLESYGLTYDKINAGGGRVHLVGWGPMTRLIKDKRLDAGVFATPIPVPQLLDITTSTPIRVLPVEPKQLAWFKKNYPAYYEMTIPAGSYKGHDKDVTTLGDSVTMTIGSKFPDDFVYNVTKALFDNKKVLVKVHGALKGMSPETALEGVKMPLHSGAYRFYKEAGVDVPAEIKP